MHSTPAVLALFLAGCALLAAAARWWLPAFPWRAALGYVALTAAFFAAPLFTRALQVPTDLAYQWLPLSEAPAAAADAGRPHNFFQADTLFEQLPFHTLARRRLLSGEAPLWSHELGTGQPLLGNGQSAPFAPLHALALPLAPVKGLTVAGAWQVLLGLLGAHALLLWLGAGAWGAALGAVGSGLSTYAVVWIYDTPGMAAAWVPGLLLGILMVRAGAPRGWAGLAACALGLALSGHPETMAHAGLAAAAVAGVLLLARRPGRWRFLGRLAAAAALAGALAAPALFPLLQNLPESVHGSALARGRENFQPPPLEARFLLPLFEPLAMGSPADGTYESAWSFNEICSDYAGLLVLALAVAAGAVLRGRPLLVLVGGLAALLAALRVPPFFDLMLRLPVIGPGAHGRMRELWVLAIALAAGLALERVAREKALRRVAMALIAAAAAGFALAPPPGAAPWPRAWWAVTLAGAAAALIALAVPRLRTGFPPLAVAAVTLDLFLLGVRYHPPVLPALDLSPTPTLAYLERQGDAAGAPFRVSFEGTDLPPNLNALYGLWDPRGYDPMRPEDAARMVGWWLGHRRRFYQNIGETLAVPNQAAHDFLAVRFLSTSHERELPPPWRLAIEGSGGRVWENPRALPLFFMPRAVERQADLDSAQRAAMKHEDFAATVFVAGGEPGGEPGAEPGGTSAGTPGGESAGPPGGPSRGNPGGESAGASGDRPQDGRVRAIRPLSNGFDLEVESATGGLVASSVSYVRDWKVRIVDGGEAPALEVNGGFLGFRVPAGTHAVRLRYEPRGWTLGLWACAAGIAACLAGWWARRRGWRVMGWFEATGEESREAGRG
jgi:hypothetical protein